MKYASDMWGLLSCRASGKSMLYLSGVLTLLVNSVFVLKSFLRKRKQLHEAQTVYSYWFP